MRWKRSRCASDDTYDLFCVFLTPLQSGPENVFSSAFLTSRGLQRDFSKEYHMRPPAWHPPVELSSLEQTIIARVW